MKKATTLAEAEKMAKAPNAPQGAILHPASLNDDKPEMRFLIENGKELVKLVPNMRKTSDRVRFGLTALKDKYHTKYAESNKANTTKRLSASKARIFFEFCEENLGLSEHQVNRMIRNSRFLAAATTKLTPDGKTRFDENRHLLDDSVLDELQKLAKLSSVTVSIDHEGHFVVTSPKGQFPLKGATVERLRDIRSQIAGTQEKSAAQKKVLHDEAPDLWVDGNSSNKPFTYVTGNACPNGSRQTSVVAINVNPVPEVQGDNLAFSPGKEDIDAFVTLKGGDGVVIRWYCAAEKRWYQGAAVATAGGTQS